MVDADHGVQMLILLAALLLHEVPNGKTLLGAVLVTAGTLIIAFA